MFTPFLHLSAAWLHWLPAWKLMPQRKESKLIQAYFWMMVLSSFFHLFMGLQQIVPVHWFVIRDHLAFGHHAVLAVLTVFVVPLFLGANTSQPNSLGKAFFRVVFARFGIYFWARLVSLFLVIVFVLELYAWLPSWLYFIFWKGQLIFISTMGAVWLISLLLGNRHHPMGATAGSAHWYYIFFGLMLLVSLSPEFLGKSTFRKVLGTIAPLTSVPFSLLFAWSRFRLTFLEVIIKRGITWILYLALFLFVVEVYPELKPAALIPFIFFAGLVNPFGDRLARLWRPHFHDSAFFKQVRSVLSRQSKALEAKKALAHFLSDIFQANIEMDPLSKPDIEIPGDPHVAVSIGLIKGIYPWHERDHQRLLWSLTQLQDYLKLLEAFEERASERSKAQRLEKEKVEAQLEALKAQIQPHFLFNTLNSIHGLIREDPAKAEKTLEHLADLVRGFLQTNPSHTVPLSVEWQMVEAYLFIEQVRFEDRLSVTSPQGPIPDVFVPHLSVQPLVENAVKYGMDSVNGAQIQVEWKEDLTGLSISIAGHVPVEPARSAKGLGIALENIQQRLKIIYGSKAVLRRSLRDGFYVTELFIPKEESCGP